MASMSGLGFGIAFGIICGVGTVDLVRELRKAASESSEPEPMIIKVQPEMWSMPDYESARHWKVQGGEV